VDNLPQPLPPLFLLVGDEELFVTRAIRAIAAAAGRQDPQVSETEVLGSAIEGPELHELVGPSLFSDARLLVVRAAQDVRTAAFDVLKGYITEPADGVVLVLHHAGGAKGKALLEAARKAKAAEIGCAKLTRPQERLDFVRNEIRRAGGRIAPDALAALVDAVGNDLRELAGVSAQLVSDSGGNVTLGVVRAFHQGRAEVSGFTVADMAVAGNADGALEALRFALEVGVPHVVIADAIADGVSMLARVYPVPRSGRVSTADGGSLARMPTWKVNKARDKARAWSEPGIREAMGIVATLNADVKGAAADPAYALERAIREIARARRPS
jgi:DNA polymerase-3 subunit delta